MMCATPDLNAQRTKEDLLKKPGLPIYTKLHFLLTLSYVHPLSSCLFPCFVGLALHLNLNAKSALATDSRVH